MLSNYFKKIKKNELKHIHGGFCQCNCDRTKEDEIDIHDIGKAKSLEECSNICLANGWKIDHCANINSKKDEK